MARAQLDHSLPVLSTPAAARTLASWGFGAARPMKTWESVLLEDDRASLSVTSVPGQHAPGPLRLLLPPVMGSVLELDDGSGSPFRLYVSGDTLYRPRLREVVSRTGPLDAAVVHLGGTRAFGVLVTMDGRQGVDLVRLLQPDVTVPVHFDDYTVFRSPLQDFLDECRSRGVPSEIRTVTRGATVSLTRPDR